MHRESYIKFSGFMNWSFFYRGKEEFAYRHGIYELNCSKENMLYMQKLKQIRGITETEKTMLQKLVEILRKQRHGTAVVITEHDREESNEVSRLCGFQYGMKTRSKIRYNSQDQEWDEELLLSITGIDGALFMDWSGKCLAIGVIVDGEVHQEGEAGRGSRYNSICNYVKNKKSGRYLGVIISEDEHVDFVGAAGITVDEKG